MAKNSAFIVKVVGFNPLVDSETQPEALMKLNDVFSKTQTVELKISILQLIDAKAVYELTKELSGEQLSALLAELDTEKVELVISQEGFSAQQLKYLMLDNEPIPNLDIVLSHVPVIVLQEALMVMAEDECQQCFNRLLKETKVDVVKQELKNWSQVTVGVLVYASAEVIALQEDLSF